jgi:multidrug efflux pump subunit AcrB
MLVPAYLVAAGLIVWFVGTRLGTELFPAVDTGQFQIRFRAPDGTRFEKTEQIAGRVLDVIGQQAGSGNVVRTLGYVGAIPGAPDQYDFFDEGPRGFPRVALRRGSGIPGEFKERLRRTLAVRPMCSFPSRRGDIVSEVMSLAVHAD